MGHVRASLVPFAFALGCADAPVVTGESSDSGSSGSPSSLDGSTTDSTSTADTTSSSGGSETTDEGTTTGGMSLHEPGEVAVLVQIWDENGESRFARYTAGDGATHELVPLHPDDGHDWDRLIEYPDRRIVLASQEHGDTRVWLGSIDTPDVPDVELLDVAPVLGGTALGLTAVPGADAAMFISNTTSEVFRVDFPDGQPQAPVLIGRDADTAVPVLAGDPTGLYAVFIENPEDGTQWDFVRTALADPNPDAVDRLSDLGGGETGSLLGFTPDGTGVYLEIDNLFATANYTDLYFVDASGPGAAAPARINPILFDPSLRLGYCAAPFNPVTPAAIYSTDQLGTGAQSWYHVAIVDGVPQAPTLVFESQYASQRDCWWSPDGSWVALLVGHDSSFELVVIPIDGQTPGAAFESIAIPSGDAEVLERIAYDAESIYLRHRIVAEDSSSLVRVRLRAAVPAEPEVLVAPGVDGSPVGFLSAAGTLVGASLLYQGARGSDLGVFVLDVDAGGPPTLMSADTPLGANAVGPVISPDERFVAFSESDGDAWRTKLVDRNAPETIELVVEAPSEPRFARFW